MSRNVFDEQRTFSLERNASVKHMVTVILDLIYRPHLIRHTDCCSLPQKHLLLILNPTRGVANFLRSSASRDKLPIYVCIWRIIKLLKERREVYTTNVFLLHFLTLRHFSKPATFFISPCLTSRTPT
jgi:hypothetical protein